MIQFSKALGRLLSPILGSILLGVIQLSGIFVLDLSSFIFAFIALFLVRFPCHKVTQDPINNKISIFAQLLYGFNYLKSRSALIALLLFFATTYFVFGIVQVLTYPLILSFASEVQLGKIMTLGGMGMITATLFISIRGIRGQNYINVIFYFMLLQGFSIMLAGFYPSVILLAIAAFLFFLTVPFVNCSFQVIFQKKIAPDVQGRVFSLNNAILGLSLLLSYFTAGPLADRIFEPLMAVNTPLAKTIGQFIGAGTGRGIGLMFIVLGGLTILITIIAYQYAPLRLVEGKDSSDNS